jgi:hypothetical protein
MPGWRPEKIDKPAQKPANRSYLGQTLTDDEA